MSTEEKLICSQKNKIQKSQIKRAVPASFKIAASAFGYLSIIPLLTCFDRTTSESFMVANKWSIIPMLIMLALDLVNAAIISNFIVQAIRKPKVLRVTVYTALVGWYLFIFVISLLDLENLKELLKQMSQYYFATYIFHIATFFKFEPSVTGFVGSSKMSPAQLKKNLFNMQRSLAHWVTLGAWMASVTIIIIAIAVIMKQLEKKQTKRKVRRAPSTNASTNSNTELLQGDEPKISVETPQIEVFLKNERNLSYIAAIIGGVVCFIQLICFLSFILGSQNKFTVFVPGHWKLFKSAVPVRMNKKDFQKSVGVFRDSNPLAEGNYWLDQRANPEYPLVYGTLKQMCSYNPEKEECKTIQAVSAPTADIKPPNVVVLLIESFTPSPTFMENVVSKSSAQIETGPMFKEMYLPNLHALSKDSLNIASMSSQGLPTMYGWLGFIAGEQPYSGEINIIKDVFNSADDFPSWFKHQGYHNFYVAPSELEFDGEQNWVYRGRAPINGAPKHTADYPLWFDEIYRYFPTQEQAAELRLETPVYSSWIADRVSSREFTHWFNKSMGDKPLMGFWFSCDTHYPFSGKDDDKYYKPFEFGKGTEGGVKQSQKTDSYATMAKYADNYIGEIISFLKTTAPETIVVVTGDHGAREVPLFKPYQHVDKFDNDSALWDGSCNNKPYAHDQLFNTAAMISYLGSDPTIRAQFDQVKNQVIKTPSDHQDLVRTMYDLIGGVTHKSVPSSRNGRNLFEMAVNLTSNKQLRDHTSLRYTSIHAEAHVNDQLFRFESKSGTGEVFSGIYPTCVKVENRKMLKSGQIKNVRKIQRLYDYLNENNRVYNYKFRTNECEYPKTCNYPVSQKGFKRQDALIISSSWVGISVLIGLVLSGATYGVGKMVEMYRKRK
ncbi:Sulfatase [Hexamita inflata]|uniref:Sulfatase n=1 Tax=Hexamita inflata TaxID=28002 RepID=A0AA86UDK3_9EUKA|nr:Sulfatase [Hexamita inflata]